MTTLQSHRIFLDNRFRFWLSISVFLISSLLVTGQPSYYLLGTTLLFLTYSVFIAVGQFEAKRGKAGSVLAYGLIAADTIFVTLAIHLTGDFESPLYIVYAVLLALCLHQQSLPQFVYAVVLSFLLYGGLGFWSGVLQLSLGKLAGQSALLIVSTVVLARILRHLKMEKATNNRLVSMSQTLSKISDTLSGSLTNSREAIRLVSDLIEKEMGPYDLKCRITIHKPGHGFSPPSGGRLGVHIPILGGEYIFGTLVVNRENGNSLSLHEQNFFSSLARSLGLHLHRSKIWEDLQKQLEKIEEKLEPVVQILEHSPELHRDSTWSRENVHQMIDVVKIERGRWTMGKNICDFGRIIEEEITIARIKAERRQQQIEVVNLFTEIPLVAGDEQRLRQLVAHLLLHSILGSPSGSAIKVKLSLDESAVHVLIEDQVEGGEKGPLLFPEAEATKFEESSSTPFFGLVICKNIIDAHQGTMWAESKGPGQGRSFSFSLPIDPSSIPEPLQR